MKNLMKRTLALALALLMVLGMSTAFAASKAVAINAKNFPDATFMKYVAKFDKDKNNELSATEISKATKIDVEGKTAITSLKGIEYFTALKFLRCSGTSVKSLDLRKNTKLETLSIYKVPLSSLKINGLKKLEDVELTSTKLKSININGCTKLLYAITCPYVIEDKTICWTAGSDAGFYIDTTTTVKNGSKVLRKYGKPKTFKFTKSSYTVKRGKEFELLPLLTISPATSVYPIKFSDSKGILDFWQTNAYAAEKGTTTITAKCGGKTAKLKVTVK